MVSQELATEWSQSPDLRETIATYLQSHPGARDGVMKFLYHTRQRQTPEVLVDLEHLNTRLKAMRKIIKEQRKVRNNEDWMLSKIQLAYLLRMGYSDLWDFARLCEKLPFGFPSPPGELVLDTLGPLTRYFLGEPATRDSTRLKWCFDESNATSETEVSLSSSGEDDSVSAGMEQGQQGMGGLNTPIDRSPQTMKLCLQFDNDTCVITGLGKPMVAHIVPFAWNSTDESMEYTKKMSSALSVIIEHDPRETPLARFKRLYDHKGSSDKPWNVIAISRDLYHVWRCGKWALKWVDAAPLEDDPLRSCITLQFHWMPRNELDTFTVLEPEDISREGIEALESELSQVYDKVPEPYLEKESIGARDCRSGQLIKTGDIFTIIRNTEDIPQCKDVFDIQWSIICASAISGLTRRPRQDVTVQWNTDDCECLSCLH